MRQPYPRAYVRLVSLLRDQLARASRSRRSGKALRIRSASTTSSACLRSASSRCADRLARTFMTSP